MKRLILLSLLATVAWAQFPTVGGSLIFWGIGPTRVYLLSSPTTPACVFPITGDGVTSADGMVFSTPNGLLNFMGKDCVVRPVSPGPVGPPGPPGPIGGGGSSVTLNVQGMGYQALFGWCDYCAPGATPSAHGGNIWQFVAGQSQMIRTLGVTNANATSGAFGSIAIYAANPDGSCGALLGQTAPFSIAAASGAPIFAVMKSLLPIAAGTTYWLAYTVDVAGGGLYGQGTRMGASFNEPGRERFGQVATISTGAGAALAFNSSCGPIQPSPNIAIPLVVALP